MIRRLPAAVAILAIAALVFVGCGGDDSDAGGATTTTAEPLSEDDYIAAFATSIANPERGFGATAEQADCVARQVVGEIGADRLQDAGFTETWFNATPQPPTELTAEEADSITSAFFDCYDVTGTYVAARVGGTLTETQRTCVGEVDTLRTYLPRVLREGSDAQLTEAEAEGFVDTLLSCVPPGEVFRASVGSALAITDEQVACLNTALMSSADYRNSVVQGVLGAVDTTQQPAFADEVGQCVTLPTG